MRRVIVGYDSHCCRNIPGSDTQAGPQRVVEPVGVSAGSWSSQA